MRSSSKSCSPVVSALVARVPLARVPLARVLVATVLVATVLVTAGCATGQKYTVLQRRSPDAVPSSRAPLPSPTPPPSPTPSPMPSCLPTTGKDDAALATWVHDGGLPGHKADVGVETLVLPELTPPPCKPLTLRVSVFKITMKSETFSASAVTSFTVPYDGHLKDFGDYKKIPVVGPASMNCIGGLEVLYTGSTSMKVSELPTTLETSTMGPIVDHFGGYVPAASFQTKRVIVANLDHINILGC